MAYIFKYSENLNQNIVWEKLQFALHFENVEANK